MEWSKDPPRRMSPFKDLKSSLVTTYRTPSDDFKQQPECGFVFTNLDEMYKNMDLWHDLTALCTAYLCTALTLSCLPVHCPQEKRFAAGHQCDIDIAS